ncbi:MAG: isoaspartyl peptidase/L-asparaginase [Brevundimonas sp.]|uniref:isoaspartyl peptidase/L-asparaginase family protein n=1 Tax=Brevundimonas sp. TaxID=1871086 RepID=UPI001A333DFF|nr:isoaspartyl peptidase/L-asparaginase [Brevundimonas sp.]MBJ7446940.1 isoaspartyl peptidase/L-asparaginase [Brevundimonas sp.]
MSAPWGLVLHGGAGVRAGRNYDRAQAFLLETVNDGAERLKRGASALDVVEAMVLALETSGLFVAGRGSAANAVGDVELDASIMNGRDGRAGAVSALRGFTNPVQVARRVMERSEHVMLTSAGAEAFAAEQSCTASPPGLDWLVRPDGFEAVDLEEGHGTVGAVALDISGGLAAATSTGGIYGKRPGRVGDTPIIGGGTWADSRVAVSCTGLGEAFIRASAAHDLAARVRYAGQGLDQAAAGVLVEVARLGGDGGLIAIDAEGRIAMPYDTDGMKRAWASHHAAPQAAVF